eukprot:jgi/Mesvir1/5085/Mv22790-RA.1
MPFYPPTYLYQTGNLPLQGQPSYKELKAEMVAERENRSSATSPPPTTTDAPSPTNVNQGPSGEVQRDQFRATTLRRDSIEGYMERRDQFQRQLITRQEGRRAPVPVRGRPVRRVDPQVHQPAEAGRGPIRRGHGGGSTTPVTPQVPADEQNAPPTKERNSRARAIAGAVANEANRSLITNTYAPAMVVDVAGMALDAMGLGKVADVVTKPLDFMAKHTPIGALVNAFTDPKASAECKLLKFVSLGFGSCDKTGTSCVKGSCARDDYWKALYSGDEKALEKAKKLYDPDLPAVLQLDRAAPSGERKTVAPSSTLPMRGV